MIYFGIDGKPFLIQKGYIGYENYYDLNGKLIKKIYLDINAKPINK